MRPIILKSLTPQINPSLIDPLNDIYAKEVYSILDHPEIIFFRRMEAIKTTQNVAKAKRTVITITLNSVPFCKVEQTGKYTYIYNPELDNETSPRLKQMFIDRGFTVKLRYGVARPF